MNLSSSENATISSKISAVSFFERHYDSTKSDSSVVLLVEGDHWPIVHAVDMVSGKDEHIVAACLHDEAEILVNGVCGALVPV